MRALIGVLTFFLILSGCSGGGFGRQGSHGWYSTADESAIREFLAEKSLFELSEMWDEADFSSQRERVSQELKRRGLDPLKFYNPEADRIRSLESKIDAMESRQRRSWEQPCYKYSVSSRCTK
jgi:biotin carboxylase